MVTPAWPPGVSILVTGTVAVFGDATVTSERYGHHHRLACTCTRFAVIGSCSHLRTSMRQRHDAPGLDRLLGEVMIEVPIFTSKSNELTVTLYLGPKKKDTGIRSVAVFGGLYDYVVIGFLSPGEGRLDMRHLFIEWMVGQVEIAQRDADQGIGRECTSPHHLGDKSVPSTLEGQRSAIRELFTLNRYGNCPACHEVQSTSITT